MTYQEERDHVVLENEKQRIFGMIHWPKELEQKAPAVLICHGYGGNKCGKHRLYVTMAKRLTEAGFIVLRVDYRGSGDSEGEFSKMRLDQHVSDAIVALDYLSKHKQVDASRIGLLGRSLGGAIAVMSAKAFQNVKTLALWAPVFSAQQWQEEWQGQDLSQKHPALEEGEVWFGGQATNIAFIQEFFEMRLDQDLQFLNHLPMLHMHGEKDVNVLPSHQDDYKRYRENAEAENLFIRLPESDHDFSEPHGQKQVLDQTFEWFKRTL